MAIVVRSNVNRRGSPPVIRASLLNERTSMREYVNDLKWMSLEDTWLRAPPKTLELADVTDLKSESQRAPTVAFDNAKLLVNRYSRSPDTRVRGAQLLCECGCVSPVFT